MSKEIIMPEPLYPGARIMVIAPATRVKRDYVEGACRILQEVGFDAHPSRHAIGCEFGSFAAPLCDRLSDLEEALKDSEVRAIFCARGGYGCQQLLPYLNSSLISDNPKWLVGFSDISALHALWLTAGVASIHGPMGKHLTLTPDHNSERLIEILKGETYGSVTVDSSPLNSWGIASGRLIGGNVAVLNGLASTPYDILSPEFARGCVLFLEDIGENIYEIDRILTRLAMAGTLNEITALLIGRFTDYHEDLNYKDMDEMIHHRLGLLRDNFGFKMPVMFNVPVGHVQENYPFVEGGEVEVRCLPEKCELILLK